MAVAAGPAQGAAPTREPAEPFNIDSISVFCGFPLRIETVENKFTETTFSDGRVRVTGTGALRLTNLSTGESLIVRQPGTTTTNPAQTAVTLTGQTVLFQLPGEPLGPGLFLITGRIVATLQEPGGFLLADLEFTGKRVDLCASLSS